MQSKVSLARKPGHDHVKNQRGRSSLSFPYKKLIASFPASRFVHGVSESFEDILAHREDFRFVIHQKDRLRASHDPRRFRVLFLTNIL